MFKFDPNLKQITNNLQTNYYIDMFHLLPKKRINFPLWMKQTQMLKDIKKLN